MSSYKRAKIVEFSKCVIGKPSTYTDQFTIRSGSDRSIYSHELTFILSKDSDNDKQSSTKSKINLNKNNKSKSQAKVNFKIKYAKDFPHILDFQAELFFKDDETPIAKLERRKYILNKDNPNFAFKFDNYFDNDMEPNLVIKYTAIHDISELKIQEPVPLHSPKLKNGNYLCFFNVIMQSLFNIQQFRNIVFSKRVEFPRTQCGTILHNLQLFFAKMYENIDCSTIDLRRSFKWHDDTAGTTQDASEFYENLTCALKVIFTEFNIINKFNELFQIQYDNAEGNFVETYCLDLCFQENSMCIQEALKQFVYDSNGNKIRSLNKIPDVFVLHIPRGNPNNNYIRYPETLDLTDIAENEEDQCEYELFNVVVHSTKVACGHYYMYARRSEQYKWYKLDDLSVSEVSKLSAVFEDNNGEIPIKREVKRPQLARVRDSLTATMLFYIKKSKISKVMEPVSTDVIPDYARERASALTGPNSLLINMKKVSWSSHPYIVVNQLSDYVNTFEKGKFLTSKARGKYIIAEQSQIYQGRIDILMMKDMIAETLNLNPHQFTIWKTSNGVPSYPIKEENDRFARGNSSAILLSDKESAPDDSERLKREYIIGDTHILYISTEKFEPKVAMFNIMVIEFDPENRCRIAPQKFISVKIRTTKEEIAEMIGINVDEYEMYRHIPKKKESECKNDYFLPIQEYERIINHNNDGKTIGFNEACSIYIQKKSTMAFKDISVIEGQPISFFQAIDEKEPQSLPNVYMMSKKHTRNVTFINDLGKEVVLRIPRYFDDINKLACIFGDHFEHPFVTLMNPDIKCPEVAKLSDNLKSYCIAIHDIDPSKPCPRTIAVQYMRPDESIETRFVLNYRGETSVNIVARMREVIPDIPEKVLLVAIRRGRIVSLHTDLTTYTMHDGDIIRLQALPEGAEFRYVEHSFNRFRSECWGAPAVLPIMEEELTAVRTVVEKMQKEMEVMRKSIRGGGEAPPVITDEEMDAADAAVLAVKERIAKAVNGKKYIICNHEGTEPSNEMADYLIVADPAYRVRILDGFGKPRTAEKIGDITIRLY